MFPKQTQLKEHLRNHHGIDLYALPRAIPRLPAQLPRAHRNDCTSEVITKLGTILAVANARSEWTSVRKTPRQLWWNLREHIKQFFENTPMLFMQFINTFENNATEANTISSWLTTAWDTVREPQQTHEFLTTPTTQEMHPPQLAHNRTTTVSYTHLTLPTNREV